MESEITQFQMEAERKVAAVRAVAGVKIQERRVVTTQMPHMPALETAVKLRADGVEVWLYADEATFSTAKHDKRYERADYPSKDSLLASLLVELNGALICRNEAMRSPTPPTSRRRPCGEGPHAVTGLPGARRARERTRPRPAFRYDVEQGRGQVCLGRPHSDGSNDSSDPHRRSVHTVTERWHQRPRAQPALSISVQRPTLDRVARYFQNMGGHALR